MATTLCYEYPLNEQIRLLLRLEFLFAKIVQTAAGHSIWDSLTALQGLSEILNLAGRTELRSELLKELKRHGASLERFRQNPEVDSGLLEAVLQTIAATLQRLRNLDKSALDDLRRNDFLGAMRQRSGIPAGVCQFDMPALHHWLQQDSEVRACQVRRWLEPFQPLQEAIGLILSLLRDSAAPRETLAERGFFQQGLNGAESIQLVRVFLPAERKVFPEISGGRHRCSIRFMEQPDPDQRAGQTTEDVYFWVAYCAL